MNFLFTLRLVVLISQDLQTWHVYFLFLLFYFFFFDSIFLLFLHGLFLSYIGRWVCGIREWWFERRAI